MAPMTTAVAVTASVTPTPTRSNRPHPFSPKPKRARVCNVMRPHTQAESQDVEPRVWRCGVSSSRVTATVSY